MPKDRMTSRTGTAQINRTGHTASGQHGDDPNLKAKGRRQPRDLKP